MNRSAGISTVRGRLDRPRGRMPRRGLTLLELLAFVSAVSVLLGLMVSMARHVQSSNAEQLTRRRINVLLDRIGLEWPAAMPFDAAKAGNEPDVASWAALSSRALVETLQARADAPPHPPEPLDAWAMPIALASGEARHLGISPGSGPFLVSAGPDRRYLTRDDNLYSYDDLARPVAPPSPPGGDGQRE